MSNKPAPETMPPHLGRAATEDQLLRTHFQENREELTSPRLNKSISAHSDFWNEVAPFPVHRVDSPCLNGSDRLEAVHGHTAPKFSGKARQSTRRHHREGSLVGRMMQSEGGVGIGLELPGTPYEDFPRNLMSSRMSSTYSVVSSIYDSSGDESDLQKPHLIEL